MHNRAAPHSGSDDDAHSVDSHEEEFLRRPHIVDSTDDAGEPALHVRLPPTLHNRSGMKPGFGEMRTKIIIAVAVGIAIGIVFIFVGGGSHPSIKNQLVGAQGDPSIYAGNITEELSTVQSDDNKKYLKGANAIRFCASEMAKRDYQITGLQAQVEALQKPAAPDASSEVQNLDAQIASKDAIITQMQGDIQSRDAQIAELKASLAAAVAGTPMDDCNAQKEKITAQKDAELYAREDEIRKKNEQLAAMSKEVVAKDAEIKSKTDELAVQEALVADLQEQLASKDKLVQHKNEDLQQANADLVAIGREVNEKNNALETDVGKLRAEDDALNACQDELTKMKAAIAAVG